MHHPASTKPLLCQELVGRDQELQELGEVLLRAIAGRPQLVILASEAGLGKTKLCRVFSEASRGQRTQVLFGQAISQDQAMPFSPFLDAFRRYFETPAGTLLLVDRTLQANFAFLPRLLPQLAPFLPGAMLPLDTTGTPVQQQQAMFHSVLRGLQALAQAQQGPLLLILEDLHWADETSLELLAFLASRLDLNATSAIPAHVDKPTRLMILGTYRTGALPDAPALNRLLSQ